MGGSTNGKNYVNQPSLPRINLAIRSQDGDLVCYRVAAEKKIQDVLKTYCEEKKIRFREITFLHNGVGIRTSKTLIELGIEDGDEIDAMEHHNGGGYLTTFP